MRDRRPITLSYLSPGGSDEARAADPFPIDEAKGLVHADVIALGGRYAAAASSAADNSEELLGREIGSVALLPQDDVETLASPCPVFFRMGEDTICKGQTVPDIESLELCNGFPEVCRFLQGRGIFEVLGGLLVEF